MAFKTPIFKIPSCFRNSPAKHQIKKPATIPYTISLVPPARSEAFHKVKMIPISDTLQKTDVAAVPRR